MVHNKTIISWRKINWSSFNGLIFTQNRHHSVRNISHVLVVQIIQMETTIQNHVWHFCIIWIFCLHISHFIQCIQTFVHPAVNTLVWTQNSVKPIVTNFMYNNNFQAHCWICIPNYGYVRIFHSTARTDCSINRSNLIVRIIAIPFRIIRNGIVDVFNRICPNFVICSCEHRPRCNFSFRMR